MSPPASTTNRLLAVILTVIGLWALKWSAPVTMPLAFVLFLLALSWPIDRLLSKVLPYGARTVGTVIALLIVLALFLGAIWLSLQGVATTAPRYLGVFQQNYDAITAWLQQNGFQPPSGSEIISRVGVWVRRFMGWLWTFLGYAGLIAGLLILALPEVPRFRRKIASSFDNGDEVLSTITEVTVKLQRVLATITFTSAVTGVLTGLFCWALGIDLAFSWGLLAFFLNFIPTIGSIIAIIPPTLFAMLQFDGYWMPTLAFVGLSVIQLGMGTFVYPWAQGRTVSVSPAVLLFALTFWGFLWGIPGAFLATPLTIALIIVSHNIPSLRWLATLLSDSGRHDEARPKDR